MDVVERIDDGWGERAMIGIGSRNVIFGGRRIKEGRMLVEGSCIRPSCLAGVKMEKGYYMIACCMI